jgi:hypothetical protein
VFSGQIDFHRALRKGAVFSVVYETLEAEGEPLRAGRFAQRRNYQRQENLPTPFGFKRLAKGCLLHHEGDSLRRALWLPHALLTSHQWLWHARAPHLSHAARAHGR